MAQLTLTPDYEAGSVTIHATGLVGGEVLRRTDRNGWVPVRLFPDQVPTDGELIVTDTELALFGSIAYEMGDAYASIRLDGVNYPFQRVTGDRLTQVSNPSISAVPLLTITATATRTSTSTEHEVIGREDTITTRGPLGLRRGNLEFLTQGIEEANALTAVYASGQVALLRYVASTFAGESTGLPRSTDLYHRAESVTFTPVGNSENGRQYYQVTVAYIEKANPSDPLAGSAGWTFDALTEAYPDFAAVAADFASFSELTVGH